MLLICQKLIKDVFQYPSGEQDASVQLLQLCQGNGSAAEYVVKFCTVEAVSGWNDSSLLAVFRERLHPTLPVELACRDSNTSLFQNIPLPSVCYINNTLMVPHAPASGTASSPSPVEKKKHSPCNLEGPGCPRRSDSNALASNSATTADNQGTAAPTVLRKLPLYLRWAGISVTHALQCQ